MELEDRLFSAARRLRPSEHVPYGFEKRIMARLLSEPRVDPWLVLTRVLWKGAGAAVAVMACSSLWLIADLSLGSPQATLAEDLDSAVYAGLTDSEGGW